MTAACETSGATSSILAITSALYGLADGLITLTPKGKGRVHFSVVLKRGQPFEKTVQLKVWGEGEPTVAPVRTIKVEGNRLTLQTTSMIRDRELPITMQGIVDGDKITGWSMTSVAGQQRDTRWQATRALAE